MPRRLTVLVAVLGLALVAGCGGGDKKNANTKSSSGAPISKAEYEARLVAGLRPAQTAGSVARGITRRSSPESTAKVFDRVGGIYRKAYNDIKSIVPPREITDVHSHVVGALQSLAQDSNRARDSLRSNNRTAYSAALNDFQAQGVKLQRLGKQLTARGY